MPRGSFQNTKNPKLSLSLFTRRNIIQYLLCLKIKSIYFSPNYSPQKILAYGIGCNTKPKTIPSPVLLEAIQLHCQEFPHIYKKATLSTLRQNFTTINCDGNELATRIPLMDPSFVGTVQDIMKYGNCVKDLYVKVRRFLEETGTSEVCSWENPDISGKYLAHRDTNPLTGRPRFLIVRIVLNDSKTHGKRVQ